MIKKTVAVALSAAFLVAGCGQGGAVKQPEKVESADFSSEVMLYKDPETGCEYLIFEGYKKGGITPRLDQHGKPRGCGK
jgi:hypothetical protein